MKVLESWYSALCRHSSSYTESDSLAGSYRLCGTARHLGREVASDAHRATGTDPLIGQQFP